MIYLLIEMHEQDYCHCRAHSHHHRNSYGNEIDFSRGGMHRGMGFDVRRGDFRFLILMAISEKPMHGYALIQELGKTYQRPISAGLIYPTLQELDEMGYVTSQEMEGKKTYSLTKEGKKYLEQNKEVVDRLEMGREHAGRIGQFGFLKDLRDMRAMAMMNEESVDEEKMKKIQEILAEAKKKMAAIVFS